MIRKKCIDGAMCAVGGRGGGAVPGDARFDRRAVTDADGRSGAGGVDVQRPRATMASGRFRPSAGGPDPVVDSAVGGDGGGGGCMRDITRGDDDGGPGADVGGADSGGGNGGDLGHGVGNPDRGSAARRPDDGGGDGVRRQRVTFASGRVGPRASGHDMVVDSAVGGEGGSGAAGGNLGQRDVCGHGDDVGRDDGGGVPGSTSSSCGGGGPGTGLALGGTAGDGASGNDLGGHDHSCGGGTGNDTAAVSVAAAMAVTAATAPAPPRSFAGPRQRRSWMLKQKRLGKM